MADVNAEFYGIDVGDEVNVGIIEYKNGTFLTVGAGTLVQYDEWGSCRLTIETGYALRDWLTENLPLLPDHEPDNPQGVWCCDRHREERT